MRAFDRLQKSLSLCQVWNSEVCFPSHGVSRETLTRNELWVQAFRLKSISNTLILHPRIS
jgi:hypothetical protein